MKELKPMIHDEKNGLDYILVGDYYIPLIRVAEEPRDIGFYGSLRRNFLKDYRQALYSQLMLTGKLWSYLADLNEICVERRDNMTDKVKYESRCNWTFSQKSDKVSALIF